VDWLLREYKTLHMDSDSMREVVETAWLGGRTDDSEEGEHFLYIQAVPRKPTKFYIDFEREIVVRTRDETGSYGRGRKRMLREFDDEDDRPTKRTTQSQQLRKRPRTFSTPTRPYKKPRYPPSNHPSANVFMVPPNKKRKKMENLEYGNPKRQRTHR
jgi:hypothetical protein